MCVSIKHLSVVSGSRTTHVCLGIRRKKKKEREMGGMRRREGIYAVQQVKQREKGTDRNLLVSHHQQTPESKHRVSLDDMCVREKDAGPALE
jgi:hypothetical protein